MYMLIIRSRPGEAADEYGEAGGAHVHAFIDFADEWGAKELAKSYIVEEGWIPEVIVDVDWVTREELDEEARTAYDEATDEGSSFIYEMWSVDEEPPPEDEGEACL